MSTTIKPNKLVKELEKLQEEKKSNIEMDSLLKASSQLLLGAADRDQQILSDLGLDHIHKYQRDLTEDIIRTQKAKEIYSRNTFTGEEVKMLCNKYYLKILPSELYKGIITADLAKVVEQFKESHPDVEINPLNFFILAPIELFKTVKHEPIQKVPVNLDPILFYRIPEKGSSSRDTYKVVTEKCTLVQVYNWGNDFSEFRKYMNMFSDTVNHSEDTSPKAVTITGLSFIFLSLLFAIILNTMIATIITAFIGCFILYVNTFTKKHIDRLWNSERV